MQYSTQLYGILKGGNNTKHFVQTVRFWIRKIKIVLYPKVNKIPTALTYQVNIC